MSHQFEIALATRLDDDPNIPANKIVCLLGMRGPSGPSGPSALAEQLATGMPNVGRARKRFVHPSLINSGVGPDLRFGKRLSAALIRMTALHEIPIDEDAAHHARASLVEDVENELGQDELATIERPNGAGKNGNPKTSTEGVLRRAAPSGS